MCCFAVYSQNNKAGGESKMKKISKGLLVAVERMMRNEAANVTEKFPPKCTGIFHQPDRPVRSEAQ